jgi:hypothetical protein
MHRSSTLELILKRISVQDRDLEPPAISEIKNRLADLRSLGLQLDGIEVKNRLLHEINQKLHKSLQNYELQRGSRRDPAKCSVV